MFHHRLQIGIENQILRIRQGFNLEEGVLRKIENLSWENIIKKIESNF